MTGQVGTSVRGQFGWITIQADGSTTYQVDNDLAIVEALRGPHQVLTDVFTYVARDDQGLSASAQITVTIYGANDAPRVIGLSSTVTNIDTLLLPSAQLQALDEEGDWTTLRISGAPQHGTLRWTAMAT